jgi:hypothetical protein
MKRGYYTKKKANEIQKIVWLYVESLYSNKLKNLKEMDKCLNAFVLQNLNQEEIIHSNRSIKSKKIKTVRRSLPVKEHPESFGFDAEFYQNFEGKLTIFSKLFHEIGREGTLSNSFYEASITSPAKQDKDTTTTKRIIDQSH